jgi:class 3 adenylate cyclase
LVAVFAADVAGYSRLMGQDEVGTLRALTAQREVMDRVISEFGGRIANTAGDSLLAEFPSAVDAVQCAVEVQKALADLRSLDAVVPGLFKSNEFPNLEDVRHVRFLRSFRGCEL